jgi:hypothetical protein
MALFPNVEVDYTFGGKTHTNLVVSEGAAPAEKWLVAKAENDNVKFNYAFGPEGNQGVVLAKGKIVELGAAEYDRETARNISTIKTAAADSKRAVGINHHNIYQTRRDRFSGNNQPAPVVLTRSYIEVPLFEHASATTASTMAKAMNYGAAYGLTNVLTPGDFVKVGQDGNFVKLDTTTDSPFQIVGQVLAVERELPPAGFLQYYMDMEITEIEQWLKAAGTAPSPGGNGVDAGAYPYGFPYVNKGWLPDFNKLLNPVINKGIPFLTDGYFAAKKTVTGIVLEDVYSASNNDGHIENVVFSGNLTFGTYTAGAFTAAGNQEVATSSVEVAANSRNNALFIKLHHPIDKAETNPITVRYNDATNTAKVFGGDDIHFDFYNNIVVLYLAAGAKYHNIAIDAKLVVDPVAGVPTEWDYNGVVGAARILLQR